MMMKVAAVVASVPLALGAAVAGTGIVVVDVRELGPNGHRIVVPVPLALVRTAAALVPPQRPGDGWDEARPHLEAARGVLQALADAPDGELVRVEEADEQVVVSKEGALLRVRVHGKDEDVTVSVPLALALEALPAEDGSISPAALAGALGSARFTDLVDVRTASEHVKVTVY
jgi:hypothetical protein